MGDQQQTSSNKNFDQLGTPDKEHVDVDNGKQIVVCIPKVMRTNCESGHGKKVDKVEIERVEEIALKEDKLKLDERDGKLGTNQMNAIQVLEELPGIENSKEMSRSNEKRIPITKGDQNQTTVAELLAQKGYGSIVIE